MFMIDIHTTIAAIATPNGNGGVGIIRVSGKATSEITHGILGFIPEPRYATFCHFKREDKSVIDQGLAIFFKGPHSFTGEDVLELHGHGGPIVLDEILKRVLELGAELAFPGDFTKRAFLNDKIDLVQAEAIADLIEASSVEAARSAMRSLQGEFSATIKKLVEAVINLRLYVEAAIDFPDEEVDFLSDGKILSHLKSLMDQLANVLKQAKQGSVLNDGMKIVIVGHPNAGKSSLLNRLCGNQVAIVTEIPGTTRDIVREKIVIDGLPLYVLDTAGLRETTDEVEQEGVRRALAEIPQADRILLVIDAIEGSKSEIFQHPLIQQLLPHKDRLTIIRNKIDLIVETEEESLVNDIPLLSLSVKTGEGMENLLTHLKQCAGYQGLENVFIARRRHLDALQKANQYFDKAYVQLVEYRAGELVAEELREAQNALNEITGEFRSDDLLGRIFSSFCIGK